MFAGLPGGITVARVAPKLAQIADLGIDGCSHIRFARIDRQIKPHLMRVKRKENELRREFRKCGVRTKQDLTIQPVGRDMDLGHDRRLSPATRIADAR